MPRPRSSSLRRPPRLPQARHRRHTRPIEYASPLHSAPNPAGLAFGSFDSDLGTLWFCARGRAVWNSSPKWKLAGSRATLGERPWKCEGSERSERAQPWLQRRRAGVPLRHARRQVGHNRPSPPRTRVLRRRLAVQRELDYPICLVQYKSTLLDFN
jgi:hypothetical protein